MNKVFKEIFTSSREYSTTQRNKIGIQVDRKQNEIYLLNLNSLEYEEIEYIKLNTFPEGVTETYSQRIMTESLYGTSSPQYFYSGGENKTISFTITIIEDEHNERGSIYKLRDKLRDMGRAIYVNETMQEPLIYFELGDQFTGKGYIKSEFTHRGPYRDERYIILDISITITLVEEYDETSYSLNKKEYEYIRDDNLTINIEELDIGSSNIEDLFEIEDEDDITLLKDFAFQKATSKIFNNVYDKNELYYSSVTDMEEGFKHFEGNRWRSKRDVKRYFQNKSLEAYYDLWYDYMLITSSKVFTVQARTTNLKKLIQRIRELKEDMNSIISSKGTTISEEEFKLFEEELREFEKTVRNQINLYSAMGGATT